MGIKIQKSTTTDIYNMSGLSVYVSINSMKMEPEIKKIKEERVRGNKWQKSKEF